MKFLNPELSLNGFGLPALAAALAAATLILGFLSYRQILLALRSRLAFLLLFLRIAALCTLLAILFRTTLSFDRIKEPGGWAAVLVDCSESMSVRDSLQNKARIETAQEILFHPKEGLLGSLQKLLDTRVFSFGEKTRFLSNPSFEELAAVERATLLKEALESVSKRGPERRPSAAILLTDGRDTGEASLRGMDPGVPLHILGLGAPCRAASLFPDLAIVEVDFEKKVLAGSQTKIRVKTISQGFPALSLEAVLKCEGREVLSATVSIPGPEEARFHEPVSGEFSLPFTPEGSGFFSFEVSLPLQPGERTGKNNSFSFTLEVTEEPLKVLLFEAQPRWEYKFLRRALSKDANISLSSLLKTHVDRYYQQGASPVDLSRGFPLQRSALREFDCIVLGNVLPSDLGAPAWDALREWVAEDGGGLIFLGGDEAFASPAFPGSSLEGALPILFSREGGIYQGDLIVELTPAGSSHPSTEKLEALLLPEGASLTLPACFRVAGVKPGAQVLLQCGSAGNPGHPLLAVQRFGKGKTAAFLSDSSHKWILQATSETSRKIFAFLWGMLVRWAAGREGGTGEYASGAIQVSTDKPVYRRGESVRIRAPGGEGMEGSVVPAEGEPVALSFAKEGEGMETEFLPPSEGRYRVRVQEKARGSSGETAFLVEGDHREMAWIDLDEDLLKDMAEASGGKYYNPLEAQEIPKEVANSLTQEVEHVEWAPDRSPLFFLLFLLLLSTEWFLRRRLQLI